MIFTFRENVVLFSRNFLKFFILVKIVNLGNSVIAVECDEKVDLEDTELY